MKRPVNLFRRLSLTQQVFALILLFLAFFAAFFFVFLSKSIDTTLAEQMYDLMAARQQPIVNIIQRNAEILDEDFYEFMSSDTIQTNCLIQRNQVLAFGDNNTQEHQAVYNFLGSECKDMEKTGVDIKTGTVIIDHIGYYYRIQNAGTLNFYVASFMDETYSTSLRDSVIDSTVYVTVLAFSLILLIMIVWVFSIIHPLNQIKSYIEQIKQGKQVELYLNREDEIGEVANALVTMKDELTRQEKAKEEMIHNISHDLKTPIATIKSYSESIKDGIYPYGTLEGSVDVILDNAQRLEDKVHNLLYLNRVEYLVTSDSEGVVTNMKEVVEEVVLNSAVIRSEIRVITEVEEVFFDGLLESWRVAIENIMDNAFRYAKSYIKITVTEDDLKISNDGPKMPEDRIESLFRPYEKGEGGRFGLGLSIVSKVAKANKYKVKGYNTEDGVCFRIYRDKPKSRKNDSKKKDNRKESHKKGERDEDRNNWHRSNS